MASSQQPQELQNPLLGDGSADERDVSADEAAGTDSGAGRGDSDDDEGVVSPGSPNSRGVKVKWSLKEEWKSLIAISLPIAVSSIARMTIIFTDTAFVGHLGTVCLSATSLAQNWSGVICDLMWTAGYSLNSLCAQAIGAKNFRLAGEWLQLASVAVVCLCLLCIVGYFFTDDVIALVSNQTAVVEHSLEFNVFATLFLIPTALYMTIRQFFQAMKVVVPATVVSLVSIAFNVGANQLLVHGFVMDSWMNASGSTPAAAAHSANDTTVVVGGDAALLDSRLFGGGAFTYAGGPPAGRMIGLLHSASPDLAASELGFSDPNRTWPWPTGVHSFPIAFENGTFAGFGFPGSPLATTVSMLFQLFAFCIFCFCIKKYHAKYWGGWRCRSFSAPRVKKYLKVVLPMTIGNCVEDWGYQILAYLSGSLGATDVAAISIMFSTWGIAWTFYWVRVGFHMGNGKVDRAKAVARISFFIVLLVVGSLTVACYFLRFEIGRIFTSDPVVLATVADAQFLLCTSYFMGCTSLCASSILEGMSRNTSMAIVQGLGTWLVHVPLTVYLMLFCPYFAAKPVRAFWLGSTLAEVAKGAVMWALVLTTNWEKQMRLARERNEAMASPNSPDVGATGDAGADADAVKASSADGGSGDGDGGGRDIEQAA